MGYARIVSRGINAPSRRPLKIFAIDPMAGRTLGNRARVDVPNEQLRPGPIGRRVAVIDFDGTRKQFYTPVDLDNPALLMQGGLDPSESDPRFHQQMVYAVAMRTIENFDRALGRQMKLSTRRYGKLRIFPHAFYGANAYFSKELNALLFGYFRADDREPGENLPGQIVYTCLSHDVIAHEITHRMVHALRPLFLEPSNIDVLAFHEGFSDLIALFQHFSFPDVLREQIAKSRSDLGTTTPLVELARQFGYATGRGRALRSALDNRNAKLHPTLFEPHDRGAILVAAVFDGFHKTYMRRIQDLLRIATGGSGVLPTGDLHPDLVSRISREASGIAQRVLDMCIRAFDYLPPVDVTLGDFLRALVTADYELIPEDDLNLRSAMIEGFRLRGIYPTGVVSLAEESLLWESAVGKIPPLPAQIRELLQELFFSAMLDFEIGEVEQGSTAESEGSRFRKFYEQREVQRSFVRGGDSGVEEEVEIGKDMRAHLFKYARRHSDALGLSRKFPINPRSFHPVFRVAPNGRLVVELIAQIDQVDRASKAQFGGVPLRGGVTIVASADGTVRYAIRKPIPGMKGPAEMKRQADDRLGRQSAFVTLMDSVNPMQAYLKPEERVDRIARMANFAHLHRD